MESSEKGNDLEKDKGYVDTVLVNNVELPHESPLKQWTERANERAKPKNRKKWQAERKNTPPLCKFPYKSSHGREWQGCTMQLKALVSMCSTCCCKAGLLSANVVNTLVFGEPSSCSAWFAGVDSLARIITSMMRGFIIMRSYHGPCFSKRDKDVRIEKKPSLSTEGKQFPFHQREWSL